MRNLLKKYLGFLSRTAIKRHGIKIIAIVGWYGTNLVSEVICQLVGDSIPIRRQLARPGWDMAIPLTILGYEDKRRSKLEWIMLLLRSTLRVLLSSAQPHYVVLQMDSTIPDIASYWSELVSPEVLVIINSRPGTSVTEEGLLKRLREDTNLIASDVKEFGAGLPKGVTRINVGDNGDLKKKNETRENSHRRLELTWKGTDFDVELFHQNEFLVTPIMFGIAAALVLGIKLDQVAAKVPQIEIRPDIMVRRGMS